MGTHDHAEDPRNADVLIHLNGALVPRVDAKVSVFDSGFLMGDGVWEGLRVHGGRVAFLEQHLDRLFAGARAIDLDIGMSRATIEQAIAELLAANGMRDGVHVRLMVTRGLKHTPFQGPSVNVGPPTVVIAAEWKTPDPALQTRGLSLGTVYVRRGRPDVQDPGLNTHSKLNCVTACMQAARMGVDEGLMLDPHGFVATCNSTHFFVVRGGALWTSSGRYCLAGITRRIVLEIARGQGIEAHERDFTLTAAYSADEAFVTGTFAGVVPVRSIDGRGFGPVPGPVTARLRGLYEARARSGA